MANKNDPWYNWLNPAYAYGQYYNAAQNEDGVANRISRVAGAFGGNDPLATFYEAKKGNIPGTALNAGRTLWDATIGKAALTGNLASRIPNTLRAITGTSSIKNSKYVPGTVVMNAFGITNIPNMYSEFSNALTGKEPRSVITPNTVPQTSAKPQAPVAPNFDKMTQAEKLDWIAKNDIMSPNFQQAYAKESPQYALALKLMGVPDIAGERAYRETTTAANEEWNMANAGIRAQRKAGQKQYVRGQEGINAGTSGANLDLRAALAGTGGLMSPGLYGIGQESNISQGQQALAELAARKAIADQNLVAMQGQADLRRKQALMNAVQNRAASKEALYQYLLDLQKGVK